MLLDLNSETVHRLADVAQRLPPRRGGKKPHPSTLYRWAKGGFRGLTLETIRVGGTLCTSLEAIQRFCERATTWAGDAAKPSTTPSTASRRRSADRAERTLDRIRI
jgi:Protein of unknown function (DUF1580)